MTADDAYLIVLSASVFSVSIGLRLLRKRVERLEQSQEPPK